MASQLRLRPGRYTFGAMSLGAEDSGRLEPDVALVRRVMDSGQWIHCSPTYNRGFSFMTLRCAFDEDRAHRPPLIIKLRDAGPRWLRFEAEDACRRLGIDSIDLAQLVAMERGPGCLVDQLRAGSGPVLDELAHLLERGLIRQAALYLDARNAEATVAAAAASPLVEAVIFYWNATEDPCPPAAWSALRAAGLPVLALRTLGGGLHDAVVRGRQEELAAACGCADPVELALRLAATEPLVTTTIGGTASLAHWQQLTDAASRATPLTPEALARVAEARRS